MGYRRRNRISNKEYGRKRAMRHIEEAHAFSAEVGDADHEVKEAFFALSGKALDDLLNDYGRLNGESAEQYARVTIPRWRSGAVQMSGMVAERLFDLLPRFMQPYQKNKIVEAVWNRYGPHSSKYIYIGPDSDPEAIVAALEAYFDNVNVLYPIPYTLKRRFDWLSDNDAAAKERLLNHFMNQQRQVAIAKGSLCIPMMIDGMKGDEERRITKLSHAVFVGNHKVEIKADPLRSGFILSDSPSDAVRPPWSFKSPGSLWIVAALIAAFFGLYELLHQ